MPLEQTTTNYYRLLDNAKLGFKSNNPLDVIDSGIDCLTDMMVDAKRRDYTTLAQKMDFVQLVLENSREFLLNILDNDM